MPGVRVFDIKDSMRPEEAAHYVPSAPQRMVDPGSSRPRVIQSADVFVDRDGIMYVTDSNAGLNILEYKGS